MARRQKKSPPSVLVLHLDAARLRGEGMHLGDVGQTSLSLTSIFTGAVAAMGDITSAADLASQIRLAGERLGRYDVIVAVGHSNATGIRVGTDQFMEWSAFARHIQPLKPRRLVLVACDAGGWRAGESFFSTLRDLRRIYACPVKASKDFGTLVLGFLLPYVITERRPGKDEITFMQGAALALTGCQLREWQRTKDKGNPEGALLDVFAKIAEPIARRIPNAVNEILHQLIRR